MTDITDKINDLILEDVKNMTLKETYYLPREDFEDAKDYMLKHIHPPTKPIPPKFKSGEYVSGGLFNSGYGVQYEHDFNDPDYVESLARYRERRKKFYDTVRRINEIDELEYYSVGGPVKLKPKGV